MQTQSPCSLTRSTQPPKANKNSLSNKLETGAPSPASASNSPGVITEMVEEGCGASLTGSGHWERGLGHNHTHAHEIKMFPVQKSKKTAVFPILVFAFNNLFSKERLDKKKEFLNLNPKCSLEVYLLYIRLIISGSKTQNERGSLATQKENMPCLRAPVTEVWIYSFPVSRFFFF